MKLTQKQEKVISFIKDNMSQSGKAPSLTELMQYMNISTKRGVVNHLNALEKKGALTRTSESRGIKLTEDIFADNIVKVNILGYANAGSPLIYTQDEQIGVLRVNKTLLPISKDIFAVEIKGDSMNKKVINGVEMDNGNFAIVSKNQPIVDGDAVLAIIDDCATIKTIKKDKQMIVLYPESTNSMHKPIYLPMFEKNSIYGKVIAVLSNPMGRG
jgi:repressor LexA